MLDLRVYNQRLRVGTILEVVSLALKQQMPLL